MQVKIFRKIKADEAAKISGRFVSSFYFYNASSRFELISLILPVAR